MVLKLVILSLFLVSCTINQLSDYRAIQGFIEQDKITIDYNADKICYSPIDRTFFLLQRDDNTIRIYKNGSFFNVIGGSGFTSENFRRLTDICTGIDGSLYALDSFDRSIKRFDKDGVFINQVSLQNISSPERIAMTNFGSVFIYDSHGKEIYALDAFDMSVKYTFGKFQIDNADSFFISGNFLNIYDNESRETGVFLLNGMFENSFRGFTFYEAHRNLISLSFQDIVVSRIDRTLFSTDNRIDLFNIEHGFFIIGLNDAIYVFRGNYL